MIATVVLLAEEQVFESVLVGDMGVAVMRERAQQILVWTRAGFELVEFVSSEQGRSQEGAKEARWLGRIQDGC